MADSLCTGRGVPSRVSRLLALFGSLLFVSIANAADTTGQITVTIDGAIPNGVTVEVTGGSPITSVRKKSPASGVVTFKSLEPGSYTITPRKGNAVVSPQTRTSTVVAGKTKRVKFTSKKMDAKVGMAYCVKCHDDFTFDVYSDWLKGPHGNFEYVDASHSQFGYDSFVTNYSYPADSTKFTGFPSNETIAEDAKFCRSCHGPSVEDNSKAAKFPLIKPTGELDTVNKTQAARPIVGCEACHGGGKSHISSPFGRAVAYKAPSYVQCGQCHNKDFPSNHLTYHPAGAAGHNNPGIYEAYIRSPHMSSINDSIYADEKKDSVMALCAKCHTDQGARNYKDKDGDATTLPQAMAGEADNKSFSAVQCRTCHDSHTPTKLLEAATAATGSVKARSAEFNTCTNCHQLLNANSDTKMENSFHSDHAASIVHNHYDDPNTMALSAIPTPPPGATPAYTPAAALEGYNVNSASDTACSDCHNPHVIDMKTNREYAESGHGDLAGEGWAHYDWKSAGRRDCQRCHTTTGFVNYIKNPATYTPAANNFSHLTKGQNETLYCNGCHSNSAFDRRPYTSVTFPSGAVVSLTGDDSNLCMGCHQGRASKVQVDARIATIADGGANSFTNIHYLAAAATLFGSEVHGGYEYAGKSYVGRNQFPAHNGQKDTCVKCHMRTNTEDKLDHEFLPKVADCAVCHTGITSFADIRPAGLADLDGDGNTTEGVEHEIETMQATLLPLIYSYAKNTVAFPIVYDPANNPYWFRDTNGNGVKDTGETTGYNKFDAKLLKACYNYHTTIKDPGGFIHNHKYITELLYDSIQDLGGNVTGLIRP